MRELQRAAARHECVSQLDKALLASEAVWRVAVVVGAHVRQPQMRTVEQPAADLRLALDGRLVKT